MPSDHRDQSLGRTTASPTATTTGAGAGSGGKVSTCPPCPVNATCNPDGTCTCNPGYSECPGFDGRDLCTQVAIDSDNCGGCNNVCRAGYRCVDGACACRLTICTLRDGGSICTDTNSDPMNCGDCGRACPIDLECSLGGCNGGCGGCD